jgi:hypothetical protein
MTPKNLHCAKKKTHRQKKCPSKKTDTMENKGKAWIF